MPKTKLIIIGVLGIIITATIIISLSFRRFGFQKPGLLSPWAYQAKLDIPNTLVSAKTTQTNGIINFQYQNASVEFNLPLADSTLTRTTAGQISFTTKENNIAAEYQLLKNGIKENIILNKKPSTDQFVSTLKTTNADIYLNSDGLPVFLDPKTKQYLFHVQKPYASDASGKVTYAVTYQLYQNNKPVVSTPPVGKNLLLQNLIKLDPAATYKLIVKVDPAWLLSPSRVYPITIDPTVVHDTQSEFAAGSLNRVSDIGVASTSPSLTSYYQELPADINTVGLWHMNESSGNALDSSGNSNTGTPTGTTITAGLFGNARTFADNTTDRLISANNIPAQSITYSLWVKRSGAPAGERFLIENDTDTAAQEIFAVALETSGKVYLYKISNNVSIQTSVHGSTVITDGNWHHIAAILDSANYYLYIDGKLDASTNAGDTTALTIKPLLIGADHNSLVGYRLSCGCSIDDVAVYSRALTPEEIKLAASRRPYSVYTSSAIDLTSTSSWNSLSWTEAGVNTGDGETLADSTGLIAQWNFNQTSGGTAVVNAGSCVGCTGALTGFDDTTGQDVGSTPSGWTANNLRWGTGALMFDGTNDYINFGLNKIGPKVNAASQISFEYWVNLRSYPTAGNVYEVFAVANSTGGAIDCKIDEYGKAHIGGRSISTDTFQDATSNTILELGKWNHITGIYDYPNDTIYIYINGKLDQTQSVTFGATSYTDSASGTYYDLMGNFTTYSRFLNGTLDSARLYSRALTASEILSNYQAGNIEMQTRTGSSADPNDGTWEDWKPVTSETAISSMDSDSANWNLDTSTTLAYIPYAKSDDSTIKMEGSGSLKQIIGQGQTDTNVVGLWHLEETGTAVGTSFYDSSGSNNLGYTTNVPAVTNGFIGKARSFNGSSNFITINDSNPLDLTTAGTVELWFKRNATQNYQMLLTKGDGANPLGYQMMDKSTTNQIVFRWAQDSDTITSNAAVPNGVWTYVAGVYNGNTLAIYINGVLDKSIGYTGTAVANSLPLRIGSRSDGYYYNGAIDEVRISSIARSAEEIAEAYRAGRDHYLNKTISSTDLSGKTSLPFYVASDRQGTFLNLTVGESGYANYQPDANTVALWHLDEADVGTSSAPTAFIKDSSGNGNHATPGTGTSSPTFTQGKIGKARSFNGTSDYITAADSNSLDTSGNAITIDAWVYPRNDCTGTGDGIQNIVSKTLAYYFNLTACKPEFYWYNLSTPGYHTANNSIPLSTWSHIAAIYDGSAVKIYINGIEDKSVSGITGTGAGNTNAVFIGADSPGNSRNFDGLIDEVRISNIARTSDDIRQAYEVSARTHSITIDFKAALAASNLISNSTDYSFTINTMTYGAGTSGANLYLGDKIVIKENIGGTEYIAQGTVNAVDNSTGIITVPSWDAGSTVPSGGFTVNATVFKWQRENFDLRGGLTGQKDTISNLTLRMTNGSQGATVWLDDLRSNGGYLTTPAASSITSSNNRYFQYRSILTSYDPFVSPSLSSVTLDYSPPTTGNFNFNGLKFSGIKLN